MVGLEALGVLRLESVSKNAQKMSFFKEVVCVMLFWIIFRCIVFPTCGQTKWHFCAGHSWFSSHNNYSLKKELWSWIFKIKNIKHTKYLQIKHIWSFASVLEGLWPSASKISNFISTSTIALVTKYCHLFKMLNMANIYCSWWTSEF